MKLLFLLAAQLLLRNVSSHPVEMSPADGIYLLVVATSGSAKAHGQDTAAALRGWWFKGWSVCRKEIHPKP